MNTARLTELLESPDHGLSFDGQRVRMGGMLTEVRQKATKAGNLMGFATLEDLTGTIEALVFPRVLERVSTELMPDTAVVLSGRLSIREEEEPKLMLDTVEPLHTDAELDQMSENGALSPPSSSFYRAIRSICACPATAPSAWFSRYCSAFRVESPLCSTSKARAQSCAPRRISSFRPRRNWWIPFRICWARRMSC